MALSSEFNHSVIDVSKIYLDGPAMKYLQREHPEMEVENDQDLFADVIAPIQEAKIVPVLKAYADDEVSELPLIKLKKCGGHYEIIDGRHRTVAAIIKKKKKMEAAVKREPTTPKAVTPTLFKKRGKKPVRNIPLMSLDDI